MHVGTGELWVKLNCSWRWGWACAAADLRAAVRTPSAKADGGLAASYPKCQRTWLLSRPPWYVLTWCVRLAKYCILFSKKVHQNSTFHSACRCSVTYCTSYLCALINVVKKICVKCSSTLQFHTSFYTRGVRVMVFLKMGRSGVCHLKFCRGLVASGSGWEEYLYTPRVFPWSWVKTDLMSCCCQKNYSLLCFLTAPLVLT